MKTSVQLLIAIVTLIASHSAFAQSLNIGAGVSFNKLVFEGYEEMNMTENFNGGTYTSSYTQKGMVGPNFRLTYEFNFGKRFGLETGARYMKRGFTSTYRDRYESSNYHWEDTEVTAYKMQYVDVPITFNTYITTGEFKSYVRTGIYAGALLTQKYKESYTSFDSDGYEASSEYSSNEMDFDNEERFTGGLQFGAGASYKGFFFETNYNIGTFMLSDFDSGVDTRDLSLTVGYKWNLSKK
jgi:hypothetical protein